MDERKYDLKERMTIAAIALKLIEECYTGKTSDELINDYLRRISLLRDEDSKC